MSAPPPEEPKVRKVKLTVKVRRGLEHMRRLLLDTFEDDYTPPKRQVESWTMKRQREFNAAMEWLEQNGEDPPGEFPDYPCPHDGEGVHFVGCGCSF